MMLASVPTDLLSLFSKVWLILEAGVQLSVPWHSDASALGLTKGTWDLTVMIKVYFWDWFLIQRICIPYRMTNRPNLSRTELVLALKALCLGQTLSSWQIEMVGHPNSKYIYWESTMGQALEKALGTPWEQNRQGSYYHGDTTQVGNTDIIQGKK